MILPWNYEKIVKNFLRENTKVLSLSFLRDDLLFKIHRPELISVICEKPDDYILYQRYGMKLFTQTDERESYNLCLAQFIDYDINKVCDILKKGGHFITEQKANGLMFNLENECEKLIKLGFKIVKANQVFVKEENYFYILAKK